MQYYVNSEWAAQEIERMGWGQPVPVMVQLHACDGSGSYDMPLLAEWPAYMIESELSARAVRRNYGIIVSTLGHRPNGDALYAIPR